MSSEFNLHIRKKIESLNHNIIRGALKFQYITGTRVSEVVGKYCVTGKDFELQSWEDHPLVLFKIKSAKKDGEIRLVALPLEEQFEPWTKGLVELFKKRDQSKVFTIKKRSVQTYAKNLFKDLGLEYDVENYYYKDVGWTKKHKRNITTHGLRHFRATDLAMNYRFDELDLDIMLGWKLGIKGMASRYVMGQWYRYFPKLLKPLKLE